MRYGREGKGNRMNNLVFTVVLSALVGAYGFVSGMSYEEEQQEALQCQNMVAMGAWPEEVCK